MAFSKGFALKIALFNAPVGTKEAAAKKPKKGVALGLATMGIPKTAVVSKTQRDHLPKSEMGIPSEHAYPMPDKKHAGIAKALAAMHHDPHEAAIDRKADKILHKKH